MSSTAAPYGLIPVKRHDNLPFAGATNDYRINPNGSTATMYFGTPVYVNAAGFLAPCTATGADATTNALPAGTTLTGMQGVFMGCEYTNAQGQRIWSNYYPTGVTGDIRAMVVDDPAVVFRVQSVGSLGQDSLGANVAFSAACREDRDKPEGGGQVVGPMPYLNHPRGGSLATPARPPTHFKKPTHPNPPPRGGGGGGFGGPGPTHQYRGKKFSAPSAPG